MNLKPFALVFFLFGCGPSSPKIKSVHTEHLKSESSSVYTNITQDYDCASGNVTISRYNLSTPPELLSTETRKSQDREEMNEILSSISTDELKKNYEGTPMSVTEMSYLKATFSASREEFAIKIDSSGFEGVPQSLQNFYMVVTRPGGI